MKQFVLSALCFICLKGQSQWVEKTTNITAPIGISGLHFIDPDTGFIVGGGAGGGGFISKTTDGGATWKPCTNPLTSTVNLIAVQMIDNKIAYAVGLDYGNSTTNGGRIIKTTNGGTTWNIQSSGIYPGFLGLYFFNKDSGFAVGYGGTIVKTTDGGLNWTKVTSGVTVNLRDIDFPDATTGYIVAESLMLKSTNKGLTWVSKPSGTVNILVACDFITDKKGFVCGNTVIQRTLDGGTTWSTFSSSNIFIQDVHFPHQDTGYAVGGNGLMFKTTDGGVNWKTQTISGFGAYGFYEILFLTPSLGYAGGYAGKLYKTTNGGGVYTGQGTNTGSIGPEKMFTVFPNPGHGDFEMHLSQAFEKIEIIDCYGRQVYKLALSNELKVNLELGHLSKGIYSMRISGNNGSDVITKPIIID